MIRKLLKTFCRLPVWLFLTLGFLLVLIISWLVTGSVSAGIFTDWSKNSPEIEFDAERAYQDVSIQVSMGPRYPGSEAHRQIQGWIANELEKAGWETEIQNTTYAGHPITNIIGKTGSGHPWLVIGAHYDTRMYASYDPDLSKILEPSPGANDGASGVAVLLELARQIPGLIEKSDSGSLSKAKTIWLVFFDFEDNGDIEGLEWIMGSRAFVAGLKDKPDAAIIVDMVGDQNLNIFQEEQSDKRLNTELWNIAEQIGFQDYFFPYVKYGILDDHVPFLEAGIPAVDIIDFDYAHWHSTADTLDKISANSLEIVGKTLLNWLVSE